MSFSLTPNVEIIEGEILAIDFDTLFGPKPGSTRQESIINRKPVRVVGNLPISLHRIFCWACCVTESILRPSVSWCKRESVTAW